MIRKLSSLFDIRPGEGASLAVIAALLFLLVAANNLIKILRDSIFLGHHAVTELPHLYILVAFFAGVIIVAYTRYTAHVSVVRLILASNGIIIVTVGVFWWLLSYIDLAWSHYAFYIWSAMVTVIAVAQVWTLANQMFTANQGKRLFGLITAGGTLGGIAAGFCTQWALSRSIASDHLFFAIAVTYCGASLITFVNRRRLVERAPALGATVTFDEPEHPSAENVFSRLVESTYLQIIAAVILLSVMVSTLVDFELKAAAQTFYPSRSALTVFFSSYYGWLSVATLFAQVILSGKTLTKLGLGASLYVTPIALLNGVVAIMLWPGLMAAAFTRIADATLRNSIHRSSMEVIYMALPVPIMKTVKTFLDVVIERIGDAAAGFIILFLSISFLASFRSYVHFVCLGSILLWIVLIRVLRSGCAGEITDIHSLKDDISPCAPVSTTRVKQSLGD